MQTLKITKRVKESGIRRESKRRRRSVTDAWVTLTFWSLRMKVAIQMQALALLKRLQSAVKSDSRVVSTRQRKSQTSAVIVQAFTRPLCAQAGFAPKTSRCSMRTSVIGTRSSHQLRSVTGDSMTLIKKLIRTNSVAMVVYRRDLNGKTKTLLQPKGSRMTIATKVRLINSNHPSTTDKTRMVNTWIKTLKFTSAPLSRTLNLK